MNGEAALEASWLRDPNKGGTARAVRGGRGGRRARWRVSRTTGRTGDSEGGSVALGAEERVVCGCE